MLVLEIVQLALNFFVQNLMKVDIEVLLELVKWELLVASMLTAAILLVVIPS